MVPRMQNPMENKMENYMGMVALYRLYRDHGRDKFYRLRI